MDATSTDADYDSLRAKYAQPGYRERVAEELAQHKTAPQKSEGGDALSRIRICGACQAMGYVKREYNFRVLTEQCEECQGEGLLGTKKPSEALAEDHARRQRITDLEAAIAGADSLEELDRLEAELKALQPET
eukprot:CAMPEP_0206039282 /NCGR_PEP_ID=MMETSP1466-20131121/4656_1 /ASSEMBLY_ACC=CAM_ASM_001126 /TAXON_ID=44452 /ORGANISM="Pavlova gyrans, Strain CCMP608" /LENGTH=132 /DNA_ID=CAMNT_0053413915 /DNA_START=29 /DNA_END=427 /DNA_ORIENTATION=-